MRCRFFTYLFLFTSTCIVSLNIFAQTTISGTVMDANTGQPLDGVGIYISDTGSADNAGTLSDSLGKYSITLPEGLGTVLFAYLGYVTDTIHIDGSNDHLDVYMHTEQNDVGEVIISSKKRGRYKNKDNPAVALIRQVIAHKESNRVQHYDYVQYRQYEKMQIGTSNTPRYISHMPVMRKFNFLFQNTDSATDPGKAVVPLYMEETMADVYYRKKPEKYKTIITASKKIQFDKRYIDPNAITVFMKHLYQNIDIYKNDISIITNTFLSPIADEAPAFYKFYIIDTVEEDGVKLIEMEFTPRNKTDFLFYGNLYITLDGNYGVQKAVLNVSKDVNLNWVTDLSVKLDFQKGSDHHFYLNKSGMRAYFSIFNGKRGMYGDRTVVISGFDGSTPVADSIFAGAATVVKDIDTATDNNQYWQSARPVPLTKAEVTTYRNMDSLVRMPAFKTTSDIINTLVTGYKNFRTFELGPIYSLYSYNRLEGGRTRIGGRTTDELSKYLYGEGYVAYGFKDKDYKYLIRGAYAFNGKSIYTYPQHFIRIGYQHDLMIPGQQFQFSSNDNLLLSIRRGDNNKFFYFNNFKTEYIYEFANIMGITAQFSHQELTAAGDLFYVKEGAAPADTIRHITTSDIGLEWRWFPKQQFVQRKYSRTIIPNRYPAFTFDYNAGVKGLWNADYNYQSFRLTIDKRFYLSQLGFADVELTGGYMTGSVPYPLLYVPHSNQTYLYQISAYNLMNSLEFVNDHYAELHIDYHMMGFLLNKIPLLKQLKLREVANFKMLYGGLRQENDPAYNHDLFAFPNDSKGRQIIYMMGPTPYMEASVGIENIFNLFRVDVIRRLSYLDHPDVSKWGVRAMFNFDF